MARQILRTLKLSAPIHEADREIAELEFYEPTGALFDVLECTQDANANAKRRKDIVPTGRVLLEHLTKIDGATLSTLSFADRKAANDIAAEIMIGKLGIEDPDKLGER